jgi:hypothetical protein
MHSENRRFRYRLSWLIGLIGAVAIMIAPVISPLDKVALFILLIVVGAFVLTPARSRFGVSASESIR